MKGFIQRVVGLFLTIAMVGGIVYVNMPVLADGGVLVYPNNATVYVDGTRTGNYSLYKDFPIHVEEEGSLVAEVVEELLSEKYGDNFKIVDGRIVTLAGIDAFYGGEGDNLSEEEILAAIADLENEIIAFESELAELSAPDGLMAAPTNAEGDDPENNEDDNQNGDPENTEDPESPEETGPEITEPDTTNPDTTEPEITNPPVEQPVGSLGGLLFGALTPGGALTIDDLYDFLAEIETQHGVLLASDPTMVEKLIQFYSKIDQLGTGSMYSAWWIIIRDENGNMVAMEDSIDALSSEVILPGYVVSIAYSRLEAGVDLFDVVYEGKVYSTPEVLGDYEKKTSVADIEVAKWRFADGLKKIGATFSLYDSDPNKVEIIYDTDGVTTKGAIYHFWLDDSYEWSGDNNTYDIHFSITLKFYDQDRNEAITGTANDFYEKGTKHTNSEPAYIPADVIYFSGNDHHDVTDNNNRIEYSLELDMWLQDGDTMVKASGAGGVPFILSTVWNGTQELNEIYSNKDEKVFTNLSNNIIYDTKEVKPSSGITRGGYIQNSTADDKPYNYLTGFGHFRGKNGADKVRIGYYRTDSDKGTLEMRVGYRAYSIDHIASGSGFTVGSGSKLTDTEMIPIPVASNPGNPTDQSATINSKVNSSSVLSKYTLKEVYYGEGSGRRNSSDSHTPGDSDYPVNYVELKDGTKIYVGQEIKASQIPLIKMDKNVEIAVETLAVADAAKLNYHFKNDQIPTTATAGNPDLVENYKRDVDPTSNGSYKPGAIVTGNDGKQYQLVGWYEEDTFTTPYNFNTTLSGDKDIYAKWIEYTPPSTGGGGGGSSSTVKLNFDKNGNPAAPNTKSQEGSKNFIGDYPTTMRPGNIIDGQKFTGWYLDKDGKIPFDFKNTPIDKNTTIYAGWEKVDALDPMGTPITDMNNVQIDPNDPNRITVDFVTEIGITPDTQIKLPGLTADNPNAPMDPTTLQPGTIIGDMMFMGWYLDEARTIPYDFNRVLSDSITLFAKWERVEGDAIDPPKQDGVRSPKTGYISSLSSNQLYLMIMILALMAMLLALGITAIKRKN